MIYIRVDVSKEIGLGHLMRCLSLAEALEVFYSITFILRETNHYYLELIKGKGFDYRTIPSQYGISEEVEFLNKCLAIDEPKSIVFDGYHLDYKYQAKIICKGKKVHLGLLHGNNYVADMIVNPVPWATHDAYKGKVKNGALILAGPNYILIGKSFREAKKYEPAKNMRSILITLGGSIMSDKVLDIYEALKDLPFTFKMVTGFIGTEKSTQACSDNLKVYSNSFEMASLMQTVDFAITAAGTTCWELCTIGVPFINYVVSDNQVSNSNYLAKNKLSINMGNIVNLNSNQLRETICTLSKDYEKRKQLSKQGKTLIDGYGSFRVASTICNII